MSDSARHKDSGHLRDRISELVGLGRTPRRIRVHHDTSDFFAVDYDDVLWLEGRQYLVRHYEREGRFGIDDQPKFWVRRALDLEDGSLKVIKMVFHERFRARCGSLEYECVRSPAKEAHILDIVRGNPFFMQGFSVRDSAGNIIRIIDYVKGKAYPAWLEGISMSSHEDYYHNVLPGVLRDYMGLVGAIGFLHDSGQTHGDIRRDHIIKEASTGQSRWIDFDFGCMHSENLFSYDIAGLGTVLIFLAGGGDVTVQALSRQNPKALERMTHADMTAMFANRVANLQKVYPYISDELSYVLNRFSAGADVFYNSAEELMDDLAPLAS